MYNYKKMRTLQGVNAAAHANTAYFKLLDADYYGVMPAPEYNSLRKTLEVNALQARRCGAEDMLHKGISKYLN